MERLKWKLQRTKRLFAEGRYKDFFTSVYANMPIFLSYGKMQNMAKYIYLHRKYDSLITEHVKSKLRRWGGVLLLIAKILYGGCGFRE